MQQRSLQWSSTFAFFLAATGTAAGLGNLWRFPFLAGENGGSAFILVYLLAVLLIGLPVMLAELSVGRAGKGSAERAIGRLTGGRPGPWGAIVWLSFLIPFVGIGYYSVVGGWVVDFFAGYTVKGGDLRLPGDTPAAPFERMLADPVRLIIGHSVYMGMVVFIVAHEIRAGIERAAGILMPIMFGLLILLALMAGFMGDFSAAARFLLQPDFSAITIEVVIQAVGQAFFSLAIGLGVMIAFGSYLPRKTPLIGAAASICLADTLVAIIGGFVIFPVVFASGISAEAGPGLIFITMPMAFDIFPGGHFFGIMFFALLFLAAFTTGIGTLEAAVSWLVGRGMARGRAAISAGTGAWVIGIVALLSFNLLSDIRPLAMLEAWADLNIFEALDLLVANLMLLVNGLLVALFAGWALKREITGAEIGYGRQYDIWRAVTRFLVPVAIVFILYSAI